MFIFSKISLNHQLHVNKYKKIIIQSSITNNNFFNREVEKYERQRYVLD